MPPIDGVPESLPATETDATNAAEGATPPVAEGAEGSAPNTDVAASPSEAPKIEATDERKTLLDATKSAVKPSVEAAASSAKPKSEAPAAEGAAATPDGNGKPPEATDDKLLPFHNHPRFRQLTAENRELRGDASQYRTIDTFMKDQGLQPQETAEGMIIMGLMKNDPKAALARLEPHVTRLREILGEALPADLQTAVNEGLTSEEVAKETARLRRQNEATTAHAKELEDTAQAQEVGRQNQAMKGAVDTWEATTRKSDPDFDKKARSVGREVRLLIAQHGRPKSIAQSVEYAKAAYKTVNDELKGIIQPAKKTNAPPTQTHGSHAAAPVAKTLADAVRNAVV